MLRTLKIVAATLLLTSAAHAVEIGKPAPAFTTKDALTGKEISLADLKGKNVVLEWNNFGCPFVQKHYNSGNMQAVQKEAIANGAVWVSVNSSGEGKQGFLKDGAEVKKALAEHKAAPSHYLLDHDGVIGRAYGATVTPHMFVIDANGMLVYNGAIDDKPSADMADIKDAKNYVTAALADLKAGKSVAESYSKPYGCGVKYSY